MLLGDERRRLNELLSLEETELEEIPRWFGLLALHIDRKFQELFDQMADLTQTVSDLTDAVGSVQTDITNAVTEIQALVTLVQNDTGASTATLTAASQIASLTSGLQQAAASLEGAVSAAQTATAPPPPPATA